MARSNMALSLDISIHAPRVGGRQTEGVVNAVVWEFQSTPPVWGGDSSGLVGREAYGTFQSTPPVWGGDCRLDGCIPKPHISIHAPRVGGRRRPAPEKMEVYHISIHAPRVGGRRGAVVKSPRREVFQSTPPVWGGDSVIAHEATSNTIFQSTPPVWGGDRSTPTALSEARYISIHAPRVGGRPRLPWPWSGMGNFNPRPPCGGATGIAWVFDCSLSHFNPRPPCGGRPPLRWRCRGHCNFNPRPPCGGRLVLR